MTMFPATQLAAASTGREWLSSITREKREREDRRSEMLRITGSLLIYRVATIGSNGKFLSLPGLFLHRLIWFRTENPHFHEMRMRLFPCHSLRFRFKVTIDHDRVSLRRVMA